LAKERKNADKRRAENDLEFYIAVFDLEKILQIPQSEVSSFYYKRKLATYNFTIYDIGKKEGYCFMWDESGGKRGSNEISTCILKFMKIKKENGIKELSFYFDNCAGQNRNRFIYSMWEYATYSLKVNIMHKFLEKGHAENEGDSMHATIECVKKNKAIYVSVQWVTLVRCAKVKKPYIFFEMCNQDFFDFKPLVDNPRLNWKMSTNNNIIK